MPLITFFQPWGGFRGLLLHLMSCRMARNFWSDCCRNTLRSMTSCRRQRPQAGAWKANPRFRNAPGTPLGRLDIGGSLRKRRHVSALLMV